MNKNEKTQYIIDLEKELESKHVYDLMEKLMRDLIVHQPANPLDFLIERLKHPEGKRIFIVGPPGSDVRTLTLQLSTHFEATVVSVGDLLNKEVSKKTDTGQKIEEYIKETLYVPDDLVVKVLKAHLSTLDKSQNFIIEGFPKTLYQSMAIVKEKIIPDLFIVVNYPEEQFKNFAKKKFSGQGRDQWQEFSESERTERGRDYLSQYQLNFKQLRESYKNHLIEVDGSKSTVLNDMARLIKAKIKPISPKRSSRILILGRSGSGRTTIMKELSQKLGFIPISMYDLLVDQVRNKTEVGQKIYDDLLKYKVIPDEIVSSILKGRLEKADCKLHGFVLEGFPKTESQVKLLQSMRLEPNFVIHLECSEDIAKRRVISKMKQIGKPLTEAEEHELNSRLKRSDKAIESLTKTYASHLIKVDATEEPSKIIERIIFSIERGV